MMKKLALISDIHGNSWALNAIISDIKSRGIKNTLNLGDSIYGPLDPIGTISILLDNNVVSIMGNEDEIIINSIKTGSSNPIINSIDEKYHSTIVNWLSNLPNELIYSNLIYCCHGTPSNIADYLIEKVNSKSVTIKNEQELKEELRHIDQKIIFCGHSHKQNIITSNDKVIINPGSVGLQAYSDDQPFFHKMENFSHHTRYSIVILLNNAIKVEHVVIPYNYKDAIKIALNKGFADWAYSIETGRV